MHPKLRIAQVAPLVERVPPKKYGGTERVVHTLTEELVKRGHDVTLFASGDSQTSAKLVSVYPRNLREAKVKDLYGTNVWNLLNLGTVYNRQNEFDIIHDHNGYMSSVVANFSDTPTVITMHGPIIPEIRRLHEVMRKPHVVTISESQRSFAPNLNHAGTVYNGINFDGFPFSEEHDGYLLFVGRISLEKGVHFAVETAYQLNLPLIIAAKVEGVDRGYFEEYIEPRLSDQIRWIGEVDTKTRNELMSRAMCFLHPVTWPEPFGLTLVEAMACGSPVVAFNQGSIPEVIKDGHTGFVVKNLQEMIQAVQKISTIRRSDCRDYALETFNEKQMADGYEKVYYEILAKK